MKKWTQNYAIGDRVRIRVGDEWHPGTVLSRTRTGMPRVRVDRYYTFTIDRKSDIRPQGAA